MIYFYSVIAGLISGMGMGGGTILIIFLTNFMNIEQHIAISTNLFFFIPTAIIASIINYKQKLIDFSLVKKIVIFGIIGAVIGAILSNRLDSTILKKIFGVFVIIMGIYDIASITYKYIKKKKTNTSNMK